VMTDDRLPPVICILILDVDGSKASPTGTSPLQTKGRKANIQRTFENQ
jgi:hypothetical protein